MGRNSPCFLDTHHSPDKFVHIPPLLRDLPGDLVGPHGIVIRLLAKPEVVPQVDQGQRDPKPHAEQGHHGRERHLEITRSHKKSSSSALETEVTDWPNSLHRHPRERCCETPQQPTHPPPTPADSQDGGGTYRSRGVFPPDEAVQDKADTENDTRIQGSCLQEQTQGKRKHTTLTRCFF